MSVALALLLTAQATEKESLTIEDLLVDSAIYENLALTKVRVILRNSADRLDRAVAMTLMTPEDAVLYEFDSYGAIDGDRELVCESAKGLSLFIRMADSARAGDAGKSTVVPTTLDTLKSSFDTVLRELQAAARYSQAVVRLVMTQDKTSPVEKGPVVASFEYRVIQRFSPSLVQNGGPGRFQVMMYPLPMKAEQTFEVYFVQVLAKNDAGVTTFEFPFDVKAPAKVLNRQMRVRLMSDGDLSDVTCGSHKAAPAGKDKARQEIRFESKDPADASPIRIGFTLSDKAKLVSASEPDVARKAWPTWTRASRKDDLLDAPERGVKGFATYRRIVKLKKDAELPPDKRREEMLKAAAETKTVTPNTSILIAPNDLFWAVGEKPPKENEKPFRTQRILPK
jgi:hypothetical protein